MVTEKVEEKTVIRITIQRLLVLDGTPSMEKILVEEVIECGTVKEIMDKVRKIIARERKNSFHFL